MPLAKDVEIAVGLRVLGILQFFYERTDGLVGSRFGSWKLLLLRTRGRKSGLIRTVELLYIEDGDDLVVVGSKGGSDSPPAWLVNLQAEPSAEVQVARTRWRVRAEIAEAAEHDRLWKRVNEVWDYDAYQRRSARSIPIVVLKKTDEVG